MIRETLAAYVGRPVHVQEWDGRRGCFRSLRYGTLGLGATTFSVQETAPVAPWSAPLAMVRDFAVTPLGVVRLTLYTRDAMAARVAPVLP